MWTEEEQLILRENYDKGPSACLALLPGKSLGSIKMKASRLGLKSSVYFTEDDIQFLYNYYPAKGAEYCAKQLNRTQEAIRNKAKRLGITYQKGVGRPAHSHQQYLSKLKERNISITPLETYTRAADKIKHTCVNNHEWLVSPASVLKGNGCPYCTNNSFKKQFPAILYYVRLSNREKTYFKLGITNHDIETRFKAEKNLTIDLIWEKHFDLGADALKEEQKLLELYKDQRISDSSFIRNGFSELFYTDVLGRA